MHINININIRQEIGHKTGVRSQQSRLDVCHKWAFASPGYLLNQLAINPGDAIF